MNDNDIEAIGLLADTLDSTVAASLLPLPPQMHVEQMRRVIREAVVELRAISTRATGEAWDMPPA